MRLDKPDTTSRDLIIEKLRTFKNDLQVSLNDPI